MMTELEQRQRVVDEAKSWLGTPYHSQARLKGIGVDCAQLPAAVYESAGMIPHIPLDPYSHQFHLHQTREAYLDMVLAHAQECAGPPQPGDFVLFKIGRSHSHGAIVVDWPHVIHAVSDGQKAVVPTDAAREPFCKELLINRAPRFFTLWGKV